MATNMPRAQLQKHLADQIGEKCDAVRYVTAEMTAENCNRGVGERAGRRPMRKGNTLMHSRNIIEYNTYRVTMMV